MIRPRLEIVPIIITTLAVVAACIFLFRGERVAARIGSDLFMQTYQFLLMIVIGSGVSVLFQTISYAREARERRRTLQREIHGALVAGYNDAKRARRLLRARARSAPEGTLNSAGGSIDTDEYDRQLDALSSAQLAIELATRRVEINRSLFRDGSELIGALSTVGKYLNSVVDEWEDIRPRIDGSPQLAMTQLPELDAFLRHHADSPRFRDGFKKPFDRALLLMEQALVSDV